MSPATNAKRNTWPGRRDPDENPIRLGTFILMLGGHGITRPLSRFRHSEVMDVAFGLGLFDFRELVQNIRRLLHPALLGVGAFENFGQGGAELQCSISDRQLGLDRQSSFFSERATAPLRTIHFPGSRPKWPESEKRVQPAGCSL